MLFCLFVSLFNHLFFVISDPILISNTILINEKENFGRRSLCRARIINHRGCPSSANNNIPSWAALTRSDPPWHVHDPSLYVLTRPNASWPVLTNPNPSGAVLTRPYPAWHVLTRLYTSWPILTRPNTSWKVLPNPDPSWHFLTRFDPS
jgi:hypothetical protein